MNEMKHKEYSAKVEYDPVDKIFVGHIVGIRDIVGFMAARLKNWNLPFTKRSSIIWKFVKNWGRSLKNLTRAS